MRGGGSRVRRVARLGAEITQTLAEMGDTHSRVRSGNQSEPENNCGEAVQILTQASAKGGAHDGGRCLNRGGRAAMKPVHNYFFVRGA